MLEFFLSKFWEFWKFLEKFFIDQFKSEIKAQIWKIIHVAYHVALILRDPPNKPIVVHYWISIIGYPPQSNGRYPPSDILPDILG